MTPEEGIFLAPADGFPFEPVHPGEMLLEDLAARNLTAQALSLKPRVPANRLTEILNGKRGICPDTALRLSCYLGPSAAFWLNLQSPYDLARREKLFGAKIKAEVEAAQGTRSRGASLTGRRPKVWQRTPGFAMLTK